MNAYGISRDFLQEFVPLVENCWSNFIYTFKPMYNDHPRDPKIVAVVEKWSLFRCHLCNKSSKWDHKMAVRRYGLVVVIRRWSIAQV
jgi:hypothetical protein